MGYYTIHKLTIVEGDDCITDYEQEICEFADYPHLFSDSAKWYACESDMKRYSKTQLGVTFLIEGEGEEKGDIWKCYFKDGKMFKTRAVLVFDEYSEEKLS